MTLALLLDGCGGGAPSGAHDASAGTAGGGSAGVSGSSGSGGPAGATATAGAGGTSGSSGAGGAAGNGAGGGGTAGNGAGGGGAAGGAAGASGASGGAGAGATAGSDGGAPDEDAGPGVFTMCDDHADFNGRGRCAATGKVGAVFALQSLTAAGARTTLTAIFGTTNPPDDAACTQESIGGSCVAYTCPRAAATPAGGMAAGAITATSSGGVLITRPDAAGAYDVVGISRALWMTPEAALTFSAAGGAIAAFGETFCGPTGAMLTKPAGAPGAGFTIDRASDLAFEWTGGAVGDLEIVFHDDTTAPAPTVDVRCFFTGATGQGTVPKAALGKIGPGAHAVASYLWVRKIGGASSGNCVELTGITTNASSTGAPFNGTATYQ
ncbi:MAG TPA: hypothetical protein VLA14_14850 [Polyangia bacterium]|nr:hypothetical protein [Polyangia bacterium]